MHNAPARSEPALRGNVEASAEQALSKGRTVLVQLSCASFLDQRGIWTAASLLVGASAARTHGRGGTADLQEWIRNENLAPDWLRVGTDIVGGGAAAPKFNASFSLTGTIPEPTTVSLLGLALVGLGVARCKRRS